MEVSIRWSKTIQFRERTLIIPLPILPNLHPLCPSWAIINYFKLTPGAPPLGPAFIVPQGVASSPLTYPTFIKSLNLSLNKSGINSSEYSGHSFRRGGASWALQAGLPSDVIQLLGDWKSDCYKQYLHVPLDFKIQSANQFAANLPKII
jgi:integrase